MATKRETADHVKKDMEKRYPKEQDKPVKDEMLQLNFRMKKSEYDKLMYLLDDEGKLFSQGVRSILRAYLKQKGAL